MKGLGRAIFIKQLTEEMMKSLFKCELNYFSSPHLSQIYDGFEKLRKIGIIDIIIKPFHGDPTKPLLKVKINNKYTVIYDTLDGLNWVEGSIEDNLNYFNTNIQADFYFKRSYNQKVVDYAPKNCQIYPLGLNYSVKQYIRHLKYEVIKDYLKDSYLFSKYFKVNSELFYSDSFEFYPILSKENKILFLTRLWDPDDVQFEHLKIEREAINKNRINCIRGCIKEFGTHFVGGLQQDSFSHKHCKELIMPFSLTNKKTYINAVKEYDICIATTGLHDSIGWKFGEYVAASRAIISEPLKYELPGGFENGRNYLIYNNEDEILKKIHFLLNNKDALFEIMNNNFHYYNNYLRSDMLVLNTLLKINQNIE
ncbi:MAG: hypothetical protein ACXV8Q_14030 [Methylobacter sp.]